MNALVSGDHTAPWLSRVRGGWHSKPLKYVCQINARNLPESTDPERTIRYIDISSVSSSGTINHIEPMSFGASPSRARRVVRHGDTIVSTVRTYLRAVAPIPMADTDLVVSTGFAVVTPTAERAQGRFLSYWLRGTLFVDEVCARSVGVSYPATNAIEVGAIPCPLPPLASQDAIANYLDRKTAAIDALIEKKQRLLELLDEKRAALINQAVTKGLDPSVPMKDSGVPWIGEIPRHWDLKRLKSICPRVVVGVAEAATHAYTLLGGVPIVRSVDLRPNRIDTSSLLRVETWFADTNRSKYVFAGDLLTQRTGEYSGMTAPVPPELDGCQCFTMVISTPSPGHDARFLSASLNSAGATYWDLTRWGSAQPNISVPIVQNAPVPCPPYPEQQKILGYLDLVDRRLPRAKVGAQIERLQEYRQALITAAVTGQIDIPEEAA